MGTRQIRNAVFTAGTQGEARHKARPAETLICHEVSGSGWNSFRLLHGVRLVAETRAGLNWREQLQKTAEGRGQGRENSGGTKQGVLWGSCFLFCTMQLDLIIHN